jgi:dienelactone hydrolase
MLRSVLLLALLCGHVHAASPASPDAPTGLQRDVLFTAYSPYSRSAELMRRTLTPLTVQRIAQSPESKNLREQAIDLAGEKFALYVPPSSRPQGYALLVYIPPWEEAGVPKSWLPAFDRHGMIFVAAANSGNAAKILDRREPLALLAAHNVMQRYHVDPQRVYIGGFSGGSRVAMRIALAYPDLFRGALLNAGSDTLGEPARPLPPDDLFRNFQESTRLVYLTNKQDSLHVSMDLASRHSMQEWCVFDVHSENTPWAGHDVPDAITWNHALGALDEHAAIDAKQLADCRTRVAGELDAQLDKVAALIEAGRRDEAQKLLYAIDARFGGLAAPRSTGLQTRLDS